MRAVDRTEAPLKRRIELQTRLEYILGDRPRTLKSAQERYVKVGVILYPTIDRANP
jgi:hypothetical protein